jgi:hypothetical protein
VRTNRRRRASATPARTGAVGIPDRAEVPFRHDQHEHAGQHQETDAAGDDGQPDPDQAQPASDQDAADRAGLSCFRTADENPRDLVVIADLVGDPGLSGATGEGETDPPQHLRCQHREESRDRTLQHPSGPDQDEADQDGQPPAVDVGDHAGRDLGDENHGLQDGADEYQLQRTQSDDRRLVDQIQRRNQREQAGGPAGEQEIDRHRGGVPAASLNQWHRRISCRGGCSRKSPGGPPGRQPNSRCCAG